MRKIITSLALNAICLVCFSVVGIGYAVTAPSGILLLYGALMMAYLLMTIDDVRDLSGKIRIKRTGENMNHHDMKR